MSIHSRLFLLVLSPWAIASGGCSALTPSTEGTDIALHAPSGGIDAFTAVPQAARENAIVLQVAGAEQPVRILPLPENGQTVYVSTLLQQSGLTTTFPRMQAVLYRHSPGSAGGIRMGIRFLKGGNQIAPEHDYALRPGDRLQVVEEETNPLEEISSIFGSSNSRRAIFGM